MAAPMGGVDQRTQARMQSAMGFQEGLARIFTAGQPEGVVTAAMQSARERGAIAAENIRARYFQAEFKQVQEARIKPLQEELKNAVALRDMALKMTVMPINRVLDPGQTRAAMDATEPPPPPQYQTVPGKTGADGVQTQETVEVPGQPLPNPALQGPQMNAMVSEEALAFIDPVSGEPVRVSSARGLDIMQKVENEFWGTYGRISTDMMNIFAEYKGNPFAENAMDQMMNQIIKQANQATTGSGDPMEAQKRFEDRQVWELEQEKRKQDLVTGGLQQGAAQLQQDVARQELEKGGLGIGETKAGYEVGASRARGLAATRPEFQSFLGDLANKPNWDDKDKVRARIAVDEFDTAEKARLLQLEKSNVFQIPPELVNIPENWMTSIREGYSAWKPIFGQEMTTITNTIAAGLKNIPKDERDAVLRQFNASDEDIWHADHNNWNDPNLRLVLEAYATSTGAAQLAEKRTMLRVLPEVVRQQPALLHKIHADLNEAMDYQDSLAAQGAVDDDGNPIVRAQRERVLADPYVHYMMAVTGDPNWPQDVKPRESEDALYQLNKAEQERQRQQQPPTEQPTGPLSQPLLESAPAPKPQARPWDVSYDEPAPREEMSEYERVYGKGNRSPLRRLADWSTSMAPPREFAPPTNQGYDSQGRAVDARTGELIELTNPYVNLPIEVLNSLRQAMPDGTAGVELIEEAIALASAASDSVATATIQ